MNPPIAAVFGGSGFVGRYLVKRLADAGALVRVAVRDPEAARFLRTAGDVGQVVPVAADVLDMATVERAVQGADWVINLTGVLSGRKHWTLDAVHGTGAGNVARAAKAAGASRLVHVSAIGAEANAPSVYGRSKAAGEAAVRAAFPEATILRPSVIIGPEDLFFNTFAGLARFFWFLPVFGCPLIPGIKLFPGDDLIHVDLYGDGGTRFQPVHVGDVADGALAALMRDDAPGRLYELGGPRVYSHKEIMDLLLEQIGRKRLLVPVPFWIFSFYAWFLEKLPPPFFSRPLLTRDQVRLLKLDNVASSEAPGLAELGVRPTAAETVLPTYLARFRPARLDHLHST